MFACSLHWPQRLKSTFVRAGHIYNNAISFVAIVSLISYSKPWPSCQWRPAIVTEMPKIVTFSLYVILTDKTAGNTTDANKKWSHFQVAYALENVLFPVFLVNENAVIDLWAAGPDNPSSLPVRLAESCEGRLCDKTNSEHSPPTNRLLTVQIRKRTQEDSSWIRCHGLHSTIV